MGQILPRAIGSVTMHAYYSQLLGLGIWGANNPVKCLIGCSEFAKGLGIDENKLSSSLSTFRRFGCLEVMLSS